jgi:phenylacetate-CoA ligase
MAYSCSAIRHPGGDETLPYGAWRDHSASLLADQLRYVATGSDLYRAKWGSATAQAARELDGDAALSLLEGLPLTEKDELREAQARRPPYGDHLVCEPEAVSRIHRTSGTTGRPLVIALTEHDTRVTQAHGARAMRCAGLGPADVVVHCLSYCMWSGGLTDHLCLEGTGASVVPFGVGNSAALVSLPRWIPFTAVSCTPSYVALLLEQLGDGPDRERWARNVRLFLVGGEPGGSNTGLRATVADALGARVVDANYGLAEVLSIFGSECPATGAMHFHGHDAIWPELIDPETQRPVEITPGAVGELVLTHLRREAQPLVRYRTYDLLEIGSTDPCRCGRAAFTFTVLGRSDDMFVVRGVNVFPAAIAEVLAGAWPTLREFVVVLPQGPTYDAIPLHVEIPAGAPDPSELAARITSRIKEVLGCACTVELVPEGTLARSEGKTSRVLRPSEGEPA